MTQRTALHISVGITAFVLALVAGLLIASGRAPSSATQVLSDSTSAGPASSALAQPGSDAAGAAYQQQIDEANRRLQEANNKLQDAYSQLQTLQNQKSSQANAPQQQAPQAATLQQAPPISPEDAARLALAAAPGASLNKTPDLVIYNGVEAYEVQLSQGTLYIDANTGQVLSNSTVAVAPSNGAAPAAGQYEDNEHEGGGDD